MAAQNVPAEAVGLRMIVVSSADEAQRLLDDLKGGANFAALAIEKSTDPTGREGGYLGKLDPATLREELRDALQGVGRGELTGVVRIPSGYAIVEVLPDSQEIQAPEANPTRLLAATAMGAVRDSLNVGGLSEADSMFLAFPKPAGWNQDLREMCRVRTESLPAILERLEQNPNPVAAPGPGESHTRRHERAVCLGADPRLPRRSRQGDRPVAGREADCRRRAFPAWWR